jgi:hypothetical protein
MHETKEEVAHTVSYYNFAILKAQIWKRSSAAATLWFIGCKNPISG